MDNGNVIVSYKVISVKLELCRAGSSQRMHKCTIQSLRSKKYGFLLLYTFAAINAVLQACGMQTLDLFNLTFGWKLHKCKMQSVKNCLSATRY